MGREGGFEAFYASHLERHQTLAARMGAALGDAVVAVGVILGLRKPTRALGVRLVPVGFALQLLGHVVGEASTLRGELDAFAHHPIWGAVADLRMFAAMALGRWPRPY